MGTNATELVPTERVTEMLGAERTTLWRLERAGELKAVRIGKRKMWLLNSVEQLIQSRLEAE